MLETVHAVVGMEVKERQVYPGGEVNVASARSSLTAARTVAVPRIPEHIPSAIVEQTRRTSLRADGPLFGGKLGSAQGAKRRIAFVAGVKGLYMS